mgnify:CR=1 FL=1
MSRWPIAVEFKEDESLSSWLIRSALSLGCDPIVLTGWLWPKWRAWTFDLDRGLNTDKISELVKCSELNRSMFEAASLLSSASKFSARDLPRHGVWPWIQALGARNRLYRGGTQYCPLCFDCDLTPYFRKHWRFSWVTACHKHAVQMIDRCPGCHMPIESHRLQALDTAVLSQCPSCCFDYRSSPILPATTETTEFQRTALMVKNDGGVTICGSVVSTHEWFDLCKHLLLLIRRSVYLPKSTLAIAIRDSCPGAPIISSDNLILQLELLNVGARTDLLASLHHLLNNLEAFSKNLESAGALSTCLVDKGGRIPISLHFLFDALIKPDPRIYGSRILRPTKAKSKGTVMKSWVRLKRKYRLE